MKRCSNTLKYVAMCILLVCSILLLAYAFYWLIRNLIEYGTLLKSASKGVLMVVSPDYIRSILVNSIRILYNTLVMFISLGFLRSSYYKKYKQEIDTKKQIKKQEKLAKKKQKLQEKLDKMEKGE